MSRLIETIRLSDGRLENLEYHLRRMRVFSEEDLAADFPKQGLFKYRIVYDSQIITATVEPYTIKPVHTLKLVENNSIVYDRKYENREELTSMLDPNYDDILIIKNGLVTDVSYANIIFLKDGIWFTPETYLLNGTMRQFLIDTGKIKEARITVGDLPSYSNFKLINAMLRTDADQSEVSNIR